MTDKPDGKRWGWGTWAWIVVLVPALSMGPVWWASDHFDLWHGYPIYGDPCFTFYAPVFWACEACHPFGTAPHWYVHLWANIAG
jgi:hypothetical protein